MTARYNRRDFMKLAAGGATAVAGARIFGTPYVMAAPEPGAKLRVAMIGCGGQGVGAHVPQLAKERLVALVDPDTNRIAEALKKAKGTNADLDTASVKGYADYRKFFDEMHKELDAVFIATPNHHHALPALLAMSHGIAVYVEKPMSYSIHEARLMAEFARKHKVATQMGNQGHSGEGYRRLVEYIQAGAIGNVTEVYSWCDRKNGGVGPRPPSMPVPEGLDWDSWIGPAAFREYHPDKATVGADGKILIGKDGKPQVKHMHPHEWHNWHEFGNGSLGNMGCHILDGAFWALNLGQPTAFECEDMNGGSDDRYPIGARLRWEYPARGEMPPVKVWWYDGARKGSKDGGAGGTTDSVAENVINKPPLLVELEKKYNRTFESNGTLYVGDKGIMYTGTYGGGTRILPEELHKATPVPEVKIPRIKGNHQSDFFRGVRDPSYQPVANFDYSARLTEMVLQGCLSMKAGVGKKIEWDGNKSTNLPEINKFIQRENRKGWENPKA